MGLSENPPHYLTYMMGFSGSNQTLGNMMPSGAGVIFWPIFNPGFIHGTHNYDLCNVRVAGESIPKKTSSVLSVRPDTISYLSEFFCQRFFSFLAWLLIILWIVASEKLLSQEVFVVFAYLSTSSSANTASLHFTFPATVADVLFSFPVANMAELMLTGSAFRDMGGHANIETFHTIYIIRIGFYEPVTTSDIFLKH